MPNEGLTTAATVRVTAALGITCGLTAWTIVGAALVIALILLVALGWMEGRVRQGAKAIVYRNRNSTPKNAPGLKQSYSMKRGGVRVWLDWACK